MKKYIILLVGVLFAGISFGQNADLRVKGLKSSLDYTLDINKSETFLFKYSSDVVTDSDSIWTVTIGVDNKYDNLKSYLRVNCDKLTGTPKTTIYLRGKKFWDEATWTTIASKAWVTGAADTIINLENTTAAAYRFYQIGFVGTAGTYTFTPKVLEFHIAK